MIRVDEEFLGSLDGPFDAAACMSCGVCTALCPMEIGSLPRELFRHAILGLAERIRQQEDTIFSCLLCRSCEASCPAEVPITENVRILRRHLVKHQLGLGE